MAQNWQKVMKEGKLIGLKFHLNFVLENIIHLPNISLIIFFKYPIFNLAS